MKALKKGRGIAPPILNLRRRWKWLFTPSRLGPFTSSGGWGTCTYWIEGWVSPTRGYHILEKRKSWELSNFCWYVIQNWDVPIWPSSSHHAINLILNWSSAVGSEFMTRFCDVSTAITSPFVVIHRGVLGPASLTWLLKKAHSLRTTAENL
jgi:hypothetical protein